MSDIEKLLIVIPARGGSKRLPRKNVLPLAGKPLICWTIEAALDAELNARIMVTSDDDEILAIAQQYEARGVTPYKRSHDLATDTASTTDVLIDAVSAEQQAGHPPATLMLLQPTSPLRTGEDIQRAVKVYLDGECQYTVVSVCEVDHPTAWVGTIGSGARFEGVDISGKRSQDYPKEYRLNGAVYIGATAELMNKGRLFTEKLLASIMPRERSIDIDTETDFKICEVWL